MSTIVQLQLKMVVLSMTNKVIYAWKIANINMICCDLKNAFWFALDPILYQ